MANLKDLEPELRDEVKSKIAQDMTGIVIAKYLDRENMEPLIDIRLFNDKIYYGSPAKSWEVIKLNDE